MSASSASETPGTIGKKDWRLAMIVNPKIRAARLNTLKMSILVVVYGEDEPQTVKDLATRLFVSPPAISRSLDVLERNKLIKRSRDKKDHRVVRLLRTRQGLDLMSEISADLDAAPAKEAA